MVYRYLKLINGYPSSCVLPQQSPIANYKQIYGEDCIEYITEGSYLLKDRYVEVTLEGVQTLRECTEFEKYTYDGESYSLPENHYFKRNYDGFVIDILERPTTNYIHPVWNDAHNIWIESATDIEIVNYDTANISNSILLMERDMKVQIGLAKANRSGDTFEYEKSQTKHYYSENTKFQQCCSDFLNDITSFEDYELAKDYMYKLINKEEYVRPTIMTKYDGEPVPQ